jgi:predicted Na+-dependent transporter
MTVATNLLFVLVAPVYLNVLLGQQIPIDAAALFRNLFCMIVVPILAFCCLRWMTPAAVALVKKASTAASIVAIFFVIFIIIAKLRRHFLEDPDFIILGFFSIGAIYTINYLVLGWALGWRQLRGVRNAMAVTSGANNIALMLVLSVLYFPPKVQLLLVIGEVVWIVAIPVYRIFLARIVPKTC